MHRVVNRITLRRPFLSRFVTTPTSSVVPVAKPSPAAESNVTKESTTPPPKKEMIWALKKEKGHGLSSEDSDADAGFEVLALMHKSNVRFTLKHFRDVDQPKTEAEAEDDEKHLAPQHRYPDRFPFHNQTRHILSSLNYYCICNRSDGFSPIPKLVLVHHFNGKK